eukprot:gene7568-9303_t
MVPPSLQKKIKTNHTIRKGAVQSVISSKPVTYSASTLSALSEANDNLRLPPTYHSQISKLQPTVTMEEPKPVNYVMQAAGQTWEDKSMSEWDPNDFRIFVGDIGNDVTDEMLKQAFASKYPSFLKAKVIRDTKTQRTKGYGFVSFSKSTDYIKALKEMNGKYVGNRPIKLKKSDWKSRANPK